MPQDYAALAKQFGGSSVPPQTEGIDYAALAKANGAIQSQPSPDQPAPARSWLDTASDVWKGMLKGAAHTGIDLAQRVVDSGMIPSVNSASFPSSDLANRARAATAYTNTPQKIGGGIETAAEMAAPALGTADALVPSAARAGANFQATMGAAEHLPINTEGAGQVALRIQDLAQRGGSMPQAVRQFLARITDPDQGQLTFGEARDFASNISRLSANETQRLTPVIAREVANMRVALNQSLAQTAGQAGKGAEYAQAMTEYAKAMRLRDAVDSVTQSAQKALPYAVAAAGGGAAGAWMTRQLTSLFGGS